MRNSIYAIRGVFVQVFAGSDIKTTVKDAIQLADYSNNEVVFNFNGILIQVDAESDINERVQYFHSKINQRQ